MPIMPQYRSPYGQSIAELLMRQGDIAARGAERSGEIWGRVAENLGNIGAQAYTAHREQKDQQKRELILDDALTTFDPMNPGASYRKLATAIGPEHATRAMSTMVSLYKMQQGEQPDPKMVVSGLAALEEKAPGYVEKNWATAGPALAPVASILKLQLDPTKPPEGFGQQLLALNSAWNPSAKGSGLERVVTKDATGAETMQWVQPKEGQTFTSAAPPKEVKPDARSLDARYAEAVATGNQGEAQKLLQAKARLEAAGRAPAGAGSKIWVVRNGQTIRIGENEYQPGDQPTGTRERAVTGAERRTLSFYMRAQEASDNIAPLEDTVRKLGTAGEAQLQWAPNLLQSTDNQLYRQAQRAFTEARLRKDSGATIKKDEYESDAKTYFAQPGDSDEVLEQKRRGRAKILEALKVEAGRAYGEHFGEDPGQQPDLPDPLGLRRPR